MDVARYIHLIPGKEPPPLADVGYFKAVLVIEAEVWPGWRDTVSDWLVCNGCRFMMAWGKDCSAWDDSVDEANLRQFDYGEIPDDDFVMTTWHEHEPLEETFWFAVHTSGHPSLELAETYIVHIALTERSAELLQALREVGKD